MSKEYRKGELAFLRNIVPVIIINKEKEKLISYNQIEDDKVRINTTYLCLIKNTIDTVSESALNKI